MRLTLAMCLTCAHLLLLPLPLLLLRAMCHAGNTYFDSLQQDASFITTTNDPAGECMFAAKQCGIGGIVCAHLCMHADILFWRL
jgi:hypothetical protein